MRVAVRGASSGEQAGEGVGEVLEEQGLQHTRRGYSSREIVGWKQVLWLSGYLVRCIRARVLRKHSVGLEGHVSGQHHEGVARGIGGLKLEVAGCFDFLRAPFERHEVLGVVVEARTRQRA